MKRIHVVCDGCGQQLVAPAEIVGKQAKCPKCGHVQPVPPAAEGDAVREDGNDVRPHSDDVWYCNFRGEVQGPYSLDELRRAARDGVIEPGTLVRQEGSADWVAAQFVSSLWPEESEPSLPQAPVEPDDADWEKKGLFVVLNAAGTQRLPSVAPGKANIKNYSSDFCSACFSDETLLLCTSVPRIGFHYPLSGMDTVGRHLGEFAFLFVFGAIAMVVGSKEQAVLLVLLISLVLHAILSFLRESVIMVTSRRIIWMLFRQSSLTRMKCVEVGYVMMSDIDHVRRPFFRRSVFITLTDSAYAVILRLRSNKHRRAMEKLPDVPEFAGTLGESVKDALVADVMQRHAKRREKK